nr:ATP-binding cassette domain-containing protein [Mesorhizobium sp.]
MHAIPRHTVAAAAEAIQIEDLHKKFGALHVLKGVSLSARDGDVVAVIGGSGSGKSTLLRCINCLENPTSGVIRVNGEEIRLKPDGNGSTVPADRQQIERIRSRLGMVFQSFNLWSHMTLLENVIEVPVHVEADWNVRCHQGGRRPGFVSTPKTESHLARHFTSSKPTEYPKRPSYPSLAGIEHRDSHSRERTAAKHAWS